MCRKRYFDLRTFLEADDDPELPAGDLRARRPAADQLARTAFTSGTTGNPKAVLHTHNTTNCALRFLNRGQRIAADSVLLVFLPGGLNWGLFNVLQAIDAGCRVILQDIFRAGEALALIASERVTHFCCAPAHLVAMLNAPAFRELRPRQPAGDHDGRRLLSDRGYPGSAGPHARTFARNVRHARVRHPGSHPVDRRSGRGLRHRRPAGVGDGHPGGGARTVRMFRPAPSERS